MHDRHLWHIDKIYFLNPMHNYYHATTYCYTVSKFLLVTLPLDYFSGNHYYRPDLLLEDRVETLLCLFTATHSEPDLSDL